jgi:hypothetical protein
MEVLVLSQKKRVLSGKNYLLVDIERANPDDELKRGISIARESTFE